MQPTTAPPEGPYPDARLIFRLLLAIDIEKYSARSAREQLHAQMNLRRALDHAIKSAGLDPDLLHRQVGGDSELLILPENPDVARMVGEFPHALATALAKINTKTPPPKRLRVRLALHYGTLVIGPGASFGPAGDAPIEVNRLLDSEPLRRHLKQRQDLNTALIVSDSLYKDVIRTGFCTLQPSDFQQVQITAKETTYQAHIHNPEHHRKWPFGTVMKIVWVGW